jgi:hypothetical protein
MTVIIGPEPSLCGNICYGGQVEGRLGRTRHERNETNAHQQALKLLGIHRDPSLREQGVGSSNLPAPTNVFSRLRKTRTFSWAGTRSRASRTTSKNLRCRLQNECGQHDCNDGVGPGGRGTPTHRQTERTLASPSSHLTRAGRWSCWWRVPGSRSAHDPGARSS